MRILRRRNAFEGAQKISHKGFAHAGPKKSDRPQRATAQDLNFSVGISEKLGFRASCREK